MLGRPAPRGEPAVALLLAREVGQRPMTEVVQRLGQAAARPVERRHLVHDRGRLVVGSIATQQAQLVVGEPPAATHDAAKHVVAARDPETDPAIGLRQDVLDFVAERGRDALVGVDEQHPGRASQPSAALRWVAKSTNGRSLDAGARLAAPARRCGRGWRRRPARAARPPRPAPPGRGRSGRSSSRAITAAVSCACSSESARAADRARGDALGLAPRAWVAKPTRSSAWRTRL